MPADPMEVIAQALMHAARNGSISTTRDWNVPTVTEATRLSPANSQAGYHHANLVAVQYGVGYDGTNTFLPFTANVSFIGPSGLSTDIVTGS